MPYFPVDDQFPFHPKTLAAGNAAIGLWTRAGAWCKNHGTAGAVPREIAASIGTATQIAQLVKAGLWEKTDAGYLFHDWQDQGGNFDAEGEQRIKDNAKARKARWKEKQAAERAALEASLAADQERSGTRSGTRSGHVSNGSGTFLPSPSPLEPVTSTTPVPETEARAGTDEESIEEVCTRQLAGLGVDFAKVRSALGTHAGRIFPPTDVVRVAATILGRAAGTPNSPTGFVISSIRNDWAEWQKLVDTGEVG
jgi:hypothetical protein